MGRYKTYCDAKEELEGELADLDYQRANVEDDSPPGEEEELEHAMELVRMKLDKLEADYEDSY